MAASVKTEITAKMIVESETQISIVDFQHYASGIQQQQQQQEQETEMGQTETVEDDQGNKMTPQVSRRQKLSRQERRELKRRERRRRRLRQTKVFCKRFVAFVFSHIGLSGLIVAYTFVGGLIFQAIEMPHERQLKERVRSQQAAWLEELKLVCAGPPVTTATTSKTTTESFETTAQSNISSSGHRPPVAAALSDAATVAEVNQLSQHRLLNEIVARIVANVTVFVKDDGWNGSLSERDYTWNFAGAILFVVTVITTIGYGHAAPKTWQGMIATMFCAFLGIPLMFLYLNNIGDYLADGFRLLYSTMCRPYLKQFRLCSVKPRGPAEVAAAAAAAAAAVSAGTAQANGALVSASTGRRTNDGLDIIRVKTDFARPLMAAWSTPAGTGRVLFVDDLPMTAASSATASSDIRGARRALAVARLLPATRHRQPMHQSDEDSPTRRFTSLSSIRTSRLAPHQRRLARSQSTPSPFRARRDCLAPSLTVPDSLTGIGRAPVVDWANIDQALTEEAEPLDEDDSEAQTSAASAVVEPLTRTISYITLPSPSGSSIDSDSSSSSSSSSSLSSLEAYNGTDNYKGYYDYVKARKSRGRGPHDKKLRQVTVPLSLSLTVMLGYVIFGSFLFTIWEQADYIKWSYFCFITLSTIGFGDIVPGTEVDSQNPKEKLIATTLYVAVGLSVFAMCFKLMQEEVIEKVRRLGRRLGIIARREPPPQPLPKSSKASRRAEQKRRRRKRQKRRQRRAETAATNSQHRH